MSECVFGNYTPAELEAKLDAVTRERDAFKAYRDSVVGVVPATCDKIMTKLGDLWKMIDKQQDRLAASEAARATADRECQRLREVLVRIRNTVVMDPRNIQWLDAALAVGGEG